MADPFTTEGKPYFFDIGKADQMAVCYSCHLGGGPAEGIVQSDGTVIPYDDPSLTPVHTYDRDFYAYNSNDITQALLSDQTIEETITSIGDPKRHDWTKSGVMEADCMGCHIDPESRFTLHAADGLKAKPFRPRMLIFAEREDGEINKVSLGMPLKTGFENESVLPYTNPLQRMSRPTALMPMKDIPPQVLGTLMQMWSDGLDRIIADGIELPYAIYGTNISKIWDQNGVIKAAYTVDPQGPADEMDRLAAARDALDDLFSTFVTYLQDQQILGANDGMEELTNLFFNNFIYAYKIKDQDGLLMPVPVPLRAYEPGKFYTDWDNPNASTRDYVRAPLVEGQGIPYMGRVGLPWRATEYGKKLALEGDTTYIDPDTGKVDTSKVVADLQAGVITMDELGSVLHDYLPSFFNMMPTAQLMGLDFNQDGAPLTYVQLVKNGDEWQAKAYYNVADLARGSIHQDMFGGSHKDFDSTKWVSVCGQCHVMTRDDGNSEWDHARTYGLGMDADWVKNGVFVNFTDDIEESGYDVHLSNKKMGCGSCHLRHGGFNFKGRGDDYLESMHNILKGTDTGHMVRNDLDNNPRPKTCESCHLAGQDPDAVNPMAKHQEKFGNTTAKHIEAIACESCHVPYRRTWRFRAFDDTLGYYTNFDNRMGYDVVSDDGKLMTFSPEYALSPVYGTSPGYGIPHFNMLSNHVDADGNGVVPMDYISQMVDYFQMDGSSDTGPLVNGMPTNPKFDFWKYFFQHRLNEEIDRGLPLQYTDKTDNEVFPPLYYANGRNGYPQVVIGNPITIMTWVDANPQPDHDMSELPYGGAKVLYLREIVAAIKEYKIPVHYGAVDRDSLATIPANDSSWAQNPDVGKIILKDSGYVIFDHTGDMYPDIWWDEDVRAMQDALTTVLKAEGVTDPKPLLFMAAHYFSDTHGVQPASKALGTVSCNDCHGDMQKDPGAHRVTDRLIGYLPWAPPWFRDENRALRYDRDLGKMVPANANGFFIVDGEVDFIEPQLANGVSFLGAKAEDVLSLSKHHAEELFYLTDEGTTTGSDIEGINQSLLTPEERDTIYVKQIVTGPWNDTQYYYVPEELKPEIKEMGMVQFPENIHLPDGRDVQAYVVRIGFNEENTESLIVKLPVTNSDQVWPEIWRQNPDSTTYEPDVSAKIVGFYPNYVIVRVQGEARYIAVKE
ncbi:MAG TPA: hypothetical protein ENI88_05795 [Desulfobulbus sp.]|nr:hypothetical protein [Desulfobulbus sp.]